jgi:prepilin-type N-terminal cleavage/methylation domain-containing protein
MKNFKKSSKASLAQRGFTLIEILVALAILSIIALLASNAFDGSRSKAQAMIGLARQVADGNLQLKTDTGCYVNRPQALFDADVAALPANNYCGRTFGQTWSRQYLAQYNVNTLGELVVDKIAAEVTVGFAVETVSGKKRYYVHLEKVPVDIIKQGLIECNNDGESKGDFATNRCRTSVDVSAATEGDFDMLYDSSR